MRKLLIALLMSSVACLGTACSTSPSGYAKHKRAGYVKKKQKSYVKRAMFTTAVENREPRDDKSTFRNDRQRIYYFTELRGMTGQKVAHRWTYKGKVMAEVKFKVKGPRWRVYSSKWLKRDWLGTWTASLVDRSGRTLSRNKFTYTQARGSWGSKGDVPASADSGESYLDKASRGVRDLYEGLFEDD